MSNEDVREYARLNVIPPFRNETLRISSPDDFRRPLISNVVGICSNIANVDIRYSLVVTMEVKTLCNLADNETNPSPIGLKPNFYSVMVS